MQVVAPMRGHFMPFVQDALHDFWCMGGEVSGAEEGGANFLLLQQVEDASDTMHRHRHALPYRVILHPMFAGQIELFCVKTQQYHRTILL